VTGEVRADGPSPRVDAVPRWLTADEQDAWRALVAVVLRLPGELERQLQREAGMSHFAYWVLALLSEAPGRRLRLSELAAEADASLSRLSHAVTRLEGRGWVTRRPCPDDARATLAELTDAGLEQVVAAAPGHVDTVRRLVFDGLDAADVADLGRVCARIVARLGAPPDA
jgi:DNA-binding MarR family transcriptional regulator